MPPALTSGKVTGALVLVVAVATVRAAEGEACGTADTDDDEELHATSALMRTNAPMRIPGWMEMRTYPATCAKRNQKTQAAVEIRRSATRTAHDSVWRIGSRSAVRLCKEYKQSATIPGLILQAFYCAGYAA
jgi:hypothetical protein